jgi:HD-GYP domain-containing protein (c-di-GMP phosphodiesterase class II)
LHEGTRRIAAGNLQSPVTVASRDEFADLARSFNGMQSALFKQILSLRNLDALHQSVLGARSMRPVVHTALERFATLMPNARICVALAIQQGEQVLSGFRSGSDEETRMVLSEQERSELLTTPRQFMHPVATRRSYLRTDDGANPTLVLPLLHEDAVLGLVTIVAAESDELDDDQRAAARRLADRLALGVAEIQMRQRLEALTKGALTGFARAVDAVSPWTAGHSERVTAVAVTIGERMKLPSSGLETLARGGLLHDIGKIGIDPSILNKAGPLTEEERSKIEFHPVLGAHILEPLSAFADAIPVVRWHHERIDGTGYPDGLAGESIHPLARILAVADVYDALVSDRPYRAGMSMGRAVSIIRDGTGTHLDSDAVAVFCAAINDGTISATMTQHREATTLTEVIAKGRLPQEAAA